MIEKRYSVENTPEYSETGIPILDQYLEEVRGPFIINNHIQSYAYGSERGFLNSRKKALSTFLNSYYDDPDFQFPERSWCVTITAEILVRDMIKDLFKEPFQDRGYSVWATPSTIDRSIRTKENHQKGADFMILQEENDSSFTPIIAGDNTVRHHTKLNKMQNLGVQLPIAMPVIVVSNEGLTYGNNDYITYIETWGRERILANDEDPYYGLSQEDIDHWKYILYGEMLGGIYHCRNQICSGNDILDDYEYTSDLLKRLNAMEECMHEVSV